MPLEYPFLGVDANMIQGVKVDDSDIGDGKALVYDSGTNRIVYSVVGGGPGGNSNLIYSKIVFFEKFQGDGFNTTFTLSGAIQNGTFQSGVWAVGSILNTMQSDVTSTSDGALYDSANIFTRHRITTTSVSKVTGDVVVDYPPMNGVEFRIYYWYSLDVSDVIEDYYRTDYVTEMEKSDPEIAAAISVNTTLFDGALNASETNVQLAFDRLDNYTNIPIWIPAQLYRINDVVVHSDFLYQAVDNHASGGNFNGDVLHWNAIGAVNLDELLDVNVANPSHGDMIYRNATEWTILHTGNSGEFLKTQGDGNPPIWGTPPYQVAGNDTQIQYNDNGIFAGDTGLTWTKGTDTLTGTNIVASTSLTISNLSGLLKASAGSVSTATEGVDYYSAAHVDERRAWRSAGFSSFTEPHDNGDGSLTISNETVRIYSDHDYSGGVIEYTLTGGTTGIAGFPAIPDNQTSYIVADYNGGVPIFDIITNVELIDESDVVPYVSVYRNGNDLFLLNWDRLGKGLVNKLHQRTVKTARFQRESGLGLTELATRVVNIATGKVWNGAVRNTMDPFASNTGIWCFFYHVGGVWNVDKTTTQYNNAKYDNGTNLVDLSTSSKYTVNWIFRAIENQTGVTPHAMYVLGNAEYNSVDAARLAKVPTSLPPLIQALGMLVGRIIVKSGATSGTIESAFDAVFLPSSVAEHHALSGLLDDDHTQYLLADGSRGLSGSWNAGHYSITIDNVNLNSGLSSPTYTEGRIFYDNVNHTLGVMSDISGPVLQVGQENWVRVINKTGSIIPDGSVVYIASQVSQLPSVALAQSNAASTSEVLGLTTHAIAINGEGWVTTFGVVRGINTNTLTEGANVYLSESTPGGYTSTTPSAPNYAICIGTCLYKHITDGEILVSINDITTALATLDTARIATLSVSGTTTLNTGLSGVLKATAGVISASSIDISSETNLAVSDPISLSGDTIGLRYNTTNLKITATEIDTIQSIATNATPSFASLTLSATSNQLVLGTTRTITITAPTPASSSRIHTIPDVGGNADFVMTLANQTIGGSKTFSSAITINPVSNQIVLGTTNTLTISSTAPAASRIYTIPDAGAAATFIVSTSTPAQGDILYHNGTTWVSLVAGISGQFLKTQGAAANPKWDTTPATPPGGSDTYVQYNDGGSTFGGSSTFTWNKNTSILTAPNIVGSTSITSNNFSNFVDINRFGFLNQTQTTLSFDGTSIFTLGDGGSGWSYYRSGIKYTISGSKQIDLLTIENPLINGRTYYVSIDSTDGSLSASISPWTLLDTKLPVVAIRWNATLTPKYWMSEERHSCLFDRRLHYYAHSTIGTKAVSVGALSGYQINGDNNADKTFSIGQSIIADEDVVQTLAQLTDPNGTSTDYVVFYRTGASSWGWKASNMPFVYNIGNTNDIIQYDDGISQMIDCTLNTRWVNSYLVMTNFQGAARFCFLMGQAQYTSLASAQAETPASFNLAGFPIAEAIIAYRITWTTITSTSQGQCRLAATPQNISLSAISTFGSAPTIDHNTLANLPNGDVHTQYAYLAGRTGGQTLIGGSAASNNLTLQSTSDVTRGAIIFNDQIKIYDGSSTKGILFGDNANGYDVNLYRDSANTLKTDDNLVSALSIYSLNTNNQLILGTTRTITITAPTPASSSRTHTIPDVGGNADFVMTLANQTIGGAKTFSSAISVTATSNHLVLSTATQTATITANTQASARIYTIPDAGASATFIVSPSTPVQGDILYHNGTTWISLVAGDSGKFLKTQGAGANPMWDTVVSGSGTVNTGVAGNLALYPTSAAAVDDAYVQNGNNIFVSIAAHAALAGTRTYTIPDAGAAATFIVSTSTPAQGDILYHNGTTWVSLIPGDSGKFLKTQGANANPMWDSVSGSGTVNAGVAGNLALYPASAAAVDDAYVQNGNNIFVSIATHATLAGTRTYTIPDAGAAATFIVSTSTPARGDILYHNGTTWVSLVAGVSGKFLKTQGAGADPMWDTATGGTTDHTALSNLTSGDAGHTQFALLAGRAGGQILYGGTAASNDLTLYSTADATKGSIILGCCTKIYDATTAAKGLQFGDGASGYDTQLYRNGANQLRTPDSLIVDAASYIGDTANAKSTLGLTINQGAADDEALSLKSSDIAHSFTDMTEADTYGLFKKGSGISGGLSIQGFGEANTTGLILSGYISSTDPSDIIPPVQILGNKLTGATNTPLGDDEAVIDLMNNSKTISRLRGNGGIWHGSDYAVITSFGTYNQKYEFTGGNLLVWDATTLGAEIHTNAAATADPNGTEADATTGWVGLACDLTSTSADKYAGTYSMLVTATSTSGRAEYDFATIAGKMYRVSMWAKKGAQGTTQRFTSWTGFSGLTSSVGLTSSWAEYVFYLTATGTTGKIRAYCNSGGSIGDELYIDNMSIKEITGGNISCAGKLTGSGGTLGLKIDTAGNAALDGSLTLGGDVIIYRGAANNLYIDDAITQTYTATNTSVVGFNQSIVASTTASESSSKYSCFASMSASVSAGQTNSASSNTALAIRTWRGGTAGRGDNGTLNNLYSLQNQYGHFSTDLTCSPISTTIQGIRCDPQFNRGTATSLSHIYVKALGILGTPSIWTSGATLIANTIRRPTGASTGYYYIATAGTTGGVEPDWSLAVTPGATIVDNDITWTAIVIPALTNQYGLYFEAMVGTGSTNSYNIYMAGTGTTATNGISWTDTNFYRSGVGQLTTDGTFQADSLAVKSSSTSTYTTISGGAAAGAIAWTLPTAQGGSGTYLKNNGSGTLSWDTPPGGSSSGYKTIWIPANAMTPSATGGAFPTTYEWSTNDVNRDIMVFTNYSNTYSEFNVVLDESWDLSTIKVKFFWTYSATPSGTVVAWSAQARALNSGDAIDQAFGTAQSITQTRVATNREHITAATPAITIAGTPAVDSSINFRIYRNISGGSDNLGVEAWLSGVLIQYYNSSSPSAW